MGAYVVLHIAPGQEEKVLLDKPDVKQLLSEHGARVLTSPVRAVPGAVPAPITIAVPDMARATQLAAALRAKAGVETAYAKPAEELP